MNTTEHTIDIIAVAEVENRTVLLDLAKHKAIRSLGPWQIVHFDSPDHRGIDCGALINLSTSRVLQSKPITYSSGHFKSRDALLLASRSVSQKDSIDLTSVIVHLPSKRGGALKSAPFRKKALLAVLAELECDSAQNQLIVGDFNDVSTADYFQNIIDSGWTAPSFSHPKNINGTYKFQGRWQHIDLALYRSKRQYLGKILAPQLLLETDTKWGGYKPKRAHLGQFYTYGYSDHLPVYIFHVND
jgi:endonuclease/exonuclease/phosphatase family metal-dependent hydrolase